MSVSTQPGHIALTVIPRGASSSANVRVNPMTPCFVAEYAPRPATPKRPTTEDRLMIRAPSERCGRASRVTRNTAVRFVARIASQDESSRSESGVGPPRPALLTRTSIRPHFSTTAEIIRAIAGASVTSAAIAIAPPPDASISRAIRWHESSLLAARATRAPSCAKRREIASPIPREAPVTRATFPSSRWPSGTTVPSLAGDARKGGIPAAGAGELDGKGKMDVFLDGDEVLHLPRAERLQLRDHLIDEELRRRGPGGHAHGVRSFEPGRIDLRRIVDEICPRSRENGLFDEPVRVGRVLRADHQDYGRPLRERADGELAVLGRVADVVFRRPLDLREAKLQSFDDRPSVFHRKRRLGDVRDAPGIADLDRLRPRDQRAERDPPRRLSQGAFHLFVSAVADQDDVVSEPAEADRFEVDLGDERTRRVDHLEPAAGCLLANAGGNPVGGEDHGRAVRHLVEFVDEPNPSLLESAHDVEVVNDLLAHVERRIDALERQVDHVDRPHDSGAEAARRGEQDPLRKARRCGVAHDAADSTAHPVARYRSSSRSHRSRYAVNEPSGSASASHCIMRPSKIARTVDVADAGSRVAKTPRRIPSSTIAPSISRHPS